MNTGDARLRMSRLGYAQQTAAHDYWMEENWEEENYSQPMAYENGVNHRYVDQPNYGECGYFEVRDGGYSSEYETPVGQINQNQAPVRNEEINGAANSGGNGMTAVYSGLPGLLPTPANGLLPTPGPKEAENQWKVYNKLWNSSNTSNGQSGGQRGRNKYSQPITTHDNANKKYRIM